MISLYFGGSRETRNATDAGALNVGKKSLTVTVKSQGGDEDQYNDVTDANNEFGLTNIDRVWGKALMVAMNAQDIKNAGKETGATSSHASAMFQAAENISDSLADKLNDPNNLYPLFNQVSQANNVRMLGGTATAKAFPGNWKTSLLEREQESNVTINPNQLPLSVNMSEISTTTDKGGNICMTGYKKINMYGHDYWFVPFKYNERPRLESQKHFEENTVVAKALSGWAKPVPNTFYVESRTTAGSPADQKATAVVKANPMTTFKMRIPHGYIRLKFPKSKAKWFLNYPLPPFPTYTSEYSYGPSSETQFKEFYVYACGNGQATASLANEYIPNTVWNCLFPTATIPQPSWNGVKNALVQRGREIDPTFNTAKLMAILNTQTLSMDDTFFIVPDPTGNTLVCVSESMVTTVAPWISGKQNASPDSDAEDFDELWPPYTYPNTVQSWTLECGSLTQPAGTGVFSFTDADGTIEWRRGTGYDGFLGEITVKRNTNIRLYGVCSCVI